MRPYPHLLESPQWVERGIFPPLSMTMRALLFDQVDGLSPEALEAEELMSPMAWKADRYSLGRPFRFRSRTRWQLLSSYGLVHDVDAGGH
jgi:hypothetical protein